MQMSDIDFLIIGAAKSATTWLHSSLVRDPHVLMPQGDLELHYFSREFARGDQWYFSHFPKKLPDQKLGERSNSYLDTVSAAPRIFASLPHVKLVAQLRNPVDRAYSDYCMFYRRGNVGKDIDNYLDPRIADQGRFLAGGRYTQQLEAYLKLYPASQLMVMFLEEVKVDPELQLRKLRDFLGLKDHVPVQSLQGKAKDKTTPMLHPIMRKYLHWLNPLVAPMRKTQTFGKLHDALASEIKYPELEPDLRKRMVDYYRFEVESLEKLLDRDVPNWNSPSVV